MKQNWKELLVFFIVLLSILTCQQVGNKIDIGTKTKITKKIDTTSQSDTINIISQPIIDLTFADTIVFHKIISTNKQWNYNWNYYISDIIKENDKTFIDNDSLYKEDILKLCTDYYTFSYNQKIAFWTLFIVDICYYESAFKSNCRYQEPVSLNYVYSEGLMQLSYGDERGYKNVLLDTKKQNILDPEVNLKTGVVIFTKQLQVRKTLFTHKFFYWSVLSKRQPQMIKFFKDNFNK